MYFIFLVFKMAVLDHWWGFEQPGLVEGPWQGELKLDDL